MQVDVDSSTKAISVLFGNPLAIINCTQDSDCISVNGFCQVTGQISWPSPQPNGQGQCTCYILGAFYGADCSAISSATISYIFGFTLSAVIYAFTFCATLYMLVVRLHSKFNFDRVVGILSLTLLSTFFGTIALSIFVSQLLNIKAASRISPSGQRILPTDIFKLVAIVFTEFFGAWSAMQVGVFWIEFAIKIKEKRQSRSFLSDAQRLNLFQMIILLYQAVLVLGTAVLSLATPTQDGYRTNALVIPGAFLIALCYLVGFFMINPLLKKATEQEKANQSESIRRIAIVLKAVRQTSLSVSLAMMCLLTSMSIYVGLAGDYGNSPVAQPATISAIFFALSNALGQFFVARYIWLAVIRLNYIKSSSSAKSQNKPAGQVVLNTSSNNAHQAMDDAGNKQALPSEGDNFADEGTPSALPKSRTPKIGLGILQPKRYNHPGRTKPHLSTILTSHGNNDNTTSSMSR